MIKLTEKLEGGALMRGIAVVGLALLAAASLPAASVAIGQLQLTNNNGYQALTFYNFTGSGNGGCDGVEYKVCNGVTINSWTLTLTYTNTGNSSPTNAPPASTVTFTSGGSNVIAPYSGSGPGYTGSLAGTWEIPLTGVGGTEPACPPCDYQLTQIELSGTINPANIPFTVGSPGNTSQFGANPNFDAIWVVQSDSTKPGFVDYSNPQFFGGAYDVTVNDQQPPPAISTSANGTYTTGTQQIPLQASGGNGTYAWSLASGSLPAGLALRTDVPSNFSSNQQAGLIGVATTPGTYNFTLNVTSAGQTVSQAFTVKITALNIKDLGNLPDAFANTAYSYSFTALNPAGTANFTVGGIPLPTGMLLSSTGVLSGTPTVPGQYIIPIFLADGTDTISRGFNLTVSAVAITTAGLLPNGTQGSAYNQTLSASGGSGGYTFSVTGGGFPNGLSLSSGGTISGTIGAFPGRYGFGVTATDSSSNFYTKQMVIDVLDVSPRLPEISLQHVDGGVVGDTESFSVGMCCGAVAPFTWGVTGLPTGMSFRFGSGNTSSWVTPGDVEIWGIPQAVGNYTVQLTSTDATSAATSVSFTYHVSQLDQNPQLPNGTLNTAYSAPLRVLGGTGPYTVSKVGGTLPDGLTLNAGAMQVSGTPLENGGFGPVLRFTDSANPSHTLVRTNPLNINNVNNLAGSGININANSNLGTVTGGNAYSNQLSACCVASYTWSVTGGALPNGITLSAGGLLSGTPTAAGTYTFLIEAADAASVASPGFRQFTLIVTPISIVTNGLPYGNLSAAYSQTLAATGGTGTLTWTLNADNYLPPGLSLSSGGVISGTPTSTGQYNVNVTVTDGSGNTATRGYNLNIYPVGGGPPLSISTAANLILTTGTSQLALDASGGTGTYTWSLSSGTLPTGLALRTDVPSFFFASQQAGLIGVATTPGTYNFTLNVVSGIQNTSRAFTVKITALNVMDSSTLPDAFANTAYSYSFTALNPAATATFTATGNPLPAGLSLSTAGVLSGTPTAAGNYNFGVNLTDGTDTISRGFNLTVSAVGITTGGLLPNGTQGSAYNQTLSASGGSGGYTFNVSGGSLPFGLSLSSGGTISGTINAGPGQYAFGVQATDSSHSSYTKQMSIDVLGVPPVMPEISLGHVDDGVMGDPDSFSVGVCCGGTAPFAWGVTGLPTGMSFRSGAGNTGSTVTPGDVEIWGIPQAAGDYTVQLTATDANSAATSQSFSFHVSQIDQNPQIPGGTLNTAYSAPLRVLGGTGPYAVTQVGGTFPDGLTLNAGAMQVSGTPLENGNFGPVLKFTDSASPSHTLVRTDGLNINNVAGTSISINTNSGLGTVLVGSSYSNQLNACCVASYTWTVTGGTTLPTGLTLSTGGLLSGTPTVAGAYTFLVKAADAASVANPGYRQFTLTVTPITITTNSLPFGNLTVAYNQTLAATGGTGTLTWTLVANNYLPPGLSLSTGGIISGTPTSTGQYSFTVLVTDGNGNIATRGFTINVYVAGGGPPFSISTAANQVLTTGTNQLALDASGGTGTFTWSLSSGTLPTGLALRTDVPSNFSSSQQAGLIGVATTPGTYNFTLGVTSGSQNTSQAFTVKVTALNIQDFNLPDAFANTAYSYSFTALNPAATATFTVGGSPLPAGLSLSTAGVLSGTPTAAGQDNFSVVLTDGTDTISRGFSLKVSAVRITTAGALPNGTQNSAYNQTVSASGGSGGYTFNVSGGSLPGGLSLSSGGAISGTINAGQPGKYGFGVTATDSSHNSYTKQMAIDVLGSSPALPDISVPHVDDGVVGDPDSFSVGVCCGGVAPFAWGVTGLPTGMSFRSGSGNTSSAVTPGDVEIWGIPQAAGDYTVQLTATDANSAATSQSFSFHVSQIDQNPQIPGGTLNTAYSAPLRVLGGTGPYAVTQVGGTFPDGLMLNAGALQVSGTPLENGNFGPVLKFTDSASPSHTLVRTDGLNINNVAGTSISINNSSSLGTVLVGSSYSNQLNACCVASYTWTVTGGTTLPTGITLSTGGLLSGTPTVAGNYTFLVKAADAASVANPSYRQFTLTVTPISITTNSLPFGNLTTAYNQTLAASGGSGTLTWTLVANNYLPPGLSLSTGGVISGTPTSTGQYSFSVTVTDANNNTATRGFTINVYVAGGGPPVSITTPVSQTLTMGTVQFALGASGGTGTYTWSLSSGTLPTGLAIRTDVPSNFTSSQQAGLIGVATTPGTYNFTLGVTSGSQNTSQAFTVKITALNIMDSGTLPDAFANTAYSYSFTALNPAATATFTVGGSPLPAGLSLSTAGVLSGTPTAAGQDNFSVVLTDGTDTISRGFSLKVSAVRITTVGALPNGTQSSAYNQTVSASGGSGGYTFNVSGGSLPGGLNLSSGGTISGTINAGPGQYGFGVTATDSSHNSYTKQMAIDVLGSSPALPDISVPHVDDGVVGDPDSFSVGMCCGGVAPFAWGVTGLPTGMSFRSGSGTTSSTVTPGSVEIWGIPQAVGDYTVQLTATDANSAATSQSFSFHVSQIDQNPQIPGGTLNTAYSAPLRVLGGTGPYAVTQVGGTFPDGLTLNAGAMQVSGTPLENGNFGPVLKFTDSASPSHTLVRTDGLNINNVAGTSISINNSSGLGTALVGSSYSNQLNACCVASYTWTVTGGTTLPTGITLSTGGLLSGTPTVAGVYTFLVKAADAASVANPGYRQFTLTVTPITITTNSLPFGNLTVAYNQTLAASGGSGTLTWTLVANNYLPPGLSLSTGGVISGTPTSTGQYSFTVLVTDGNGNIANRSLSISVYVAGGGPPLVITNTANQTLTAGTNQYALGASGGTGTYTWSLSSGTLPTGLALRTDVPSNFSSSQQAGLIGVATVPGTYNFTLGVTSGSQNTSQAFTMKVTALNIKDSVLPDAFANTAYSYTLTAVGNAGPVTFAATGGGAGLSGLSLSAAGVISGTPTPAGNYSFTLSLTDGTDTISRSFNFTVHAVNITTDGALPNGTQGSAYNQTLAASGGSGGYHFIFAGGGLPNGLTLSSGGVISGTINDQPGRYGFGVTAVDSSSNFYTKQMAIDVIGVPPALTELTLGNIGNQFPVDATLGDTYTLSIGTCCGGVAPFAWTATGLPTGMSVRSGSGIARNTITPGDVEIWGIPQAVGNYTVQLTATDANGVATSQSFPFHVSELDQKPVLPNGTLHTAYSAPVRILGGTGPYTVTVVDLNPSLPDGLTYNSGTMQIGGTPLESGGFDPILQVTDSASPSHTLLRGDVFSINNPAGQNISINTSSDLDVGVATVGVPISNSGNAVQLSACCVASYTWSVIGGALPTGITLSSGGLVSGTPTVAGTYTFLVEAADASTPPVANPGYKQFRLIVTPIVVTTASQLPDATVGVPFTVSLVATGGTGALTWSLPIFWYLPPGLTLASDGTLSGTPTSAGQYQFVALVTDSASVMGGTQLSVRINPAAALSITTTSVPAAVLNAAYSQTLTASGGIQPYSWTVSAGSLPSGVTLSSGGVLSGAPTAAGSFPFTAQVTDNASTQVTQPLTLVVGLIPQTITFAALSDVSFGVAAFPITASASSNLPVSFASTTGAVCTVTAGPSPATVTIVGVGTCTITASQAGNANYTAATAVPRSFTVNQASQTISFAALSNVSFGVAAFPITASASSNLPVSFASTTGAVCTVTAGPSPATVTIVGVGTCTITASQAGNANYTAATAVPRSFTVNQASQTISFAALGSVTLGVSPFAVGATASSGLAVSFSSITLPVCTVSVNTVTILTTGSCSIVASQTGNANYAAATPVTQTFTVNPAGPASQTITFGALNNVGFGVAPFAIGAVASSGLTVSFASATPAVCSVSVNTVTILATGLCTITANQSGNASFTAAPQVTQSFTVTPGSQTITFSALGNVAVGVAPFTVGAVASSGLTVSFASATPAVCSVSVNTVTILATGLCTITANQSGNASFAAAPQVTQSFTVTPGSQTITFNALNNVAVGVAPFAIGAVASSGLTVSFASTTLAVCSVSVNTVTILATGLCTITANQSGNASFAAAPQVTQSFTVSPALVITSTTLPAGVQGVAYSQTLSTTGGTGSVTWALSAGSLPSGVLLSGSGALNGTPASSGSFSFTAKATDASGISTSQALSLQVNAPLSVTTTTLPKGVQGVAYNQTLAAAGGLSPYTWTVSAGNLPAGVTLSGAGVLSGTPGAAGAFSFTARVADAASGAATQPLSLQIGAPLTITTAATLPSGVTGKAYSLTFAAAGGSGGPYTWSILSGTSPAGLALSAAGVLSGNPSSAASSNFTVQVNDGLSPPTNLAASITVYAVLSITTAFLPNGTVNASYGPVTLAASGGSGSVAWSATGLPAGILISAGGVLSGTPTAAGASTVVVTATDSVSSQTKNVSLGLTVAVATSALKISPASLVLGAGAGAAVTGGFTASGGTPPYAWSVASGSLPAGITLGSDGSIKGSSLQAGNFAVSIKVTDSQPASVTAQVIVRILGLGPATLPSGAATVPYSATFNAVGSVPPYVFSATGLPAGFSLSGGGVLSGTAASQGSLSFTVQVVDGAGITASSAYSLTIGQAPVSIPAPSLAGGTVGTPYSQILSATGGNPPYAWSILSGALPAGLSLAPSGTISGNPTALGSSTFAVRATDSSGGVASASAAILISPMPLTITTGGMPSGMVGFDYPQQVLGASGGVPPYTFAITSGGLPPGLTLTGGILSGTPTASGDFPITITATDSASVHTAASLSINVRPSSSDLIVLTGSLSFSLVTGATVTPPAQAVGVTSTVTTQTVDYTVTVNPAAPWLNPISGGTAPGSLSVGLSTQALTLPVGSSQTTLTLTCTSAPCAGKTQSVTVSLTVTSPPAQLTVLNSLLAFTSASTPPQAETQQLGIENSGGGSLAIASVACEASWCTVGAFPAALAGGSTVQVNVTADPTTLSAGFYRTALDIVTSAGSASVPATFFISQTASVVLAPSGVQFTMPAGGSPGNPNGSFLVGAAGGTLSWTAAVLPGATWLTLNTPSGTASDSQPGSVSFSVNGAAASLSAQAHYATIEVTAPGALDSPQDFQVVLNVTPPAVSSAPDPEPAGLLFLTAVGGSPAPQPVTIYSDSTTPVNYRVSVDKRTGSWLSVDPSLGAMSSSSPGKSTMSVNTAGLAAGVYHTGVTYASVPPTGVRTVNVTLIVQPAGLSSAGSSLSDVNPRQSSPLAGPACTPSALVPTQTGLVDNFSVPASWPTPLAIVLANNCGSPVTNGQVTATFTNGDSPLPLSLVNAATGLYSATWTPHAASAQMTISAQATAPGLAAATAQITGSVAPNGAAPALSANGVALPYNSQIGGSLAPGSIIYIAGSNLASLPVQAESYPLATTINGTSVSIGGVPAPLFYVSPGLIDAQIPFGLDPSKQYQVVVNANGALTAPQTIQLTKASPGLAANPDGSLIAQHWEDYSLVSPASPATPGDYLILYLVGMGQTDNPVASGAATPLAPLSQVTSPPVVTLGGVPATVLFAGLTPGWAGLYQVNIQVPNVTAGGNLTLTVSQGGVISNTALLPVQK